MNTTSFSKQKQVIHNSELMRSFKATTDLSKALKKDRVTVQHELQKISAGRPRAVTNPTGKDQLEELKKIKKVKEPILSGEERASKVNKADVKARGKSFLGVTSEGFNLEMVCSEKGKDMIER